MDQAGRTEQLEKKIKLWKDSLMDLTKRNKLISFKETKSSTARIIEPDIYSIFSLLAEKNKELKLKFETDFITKDDKSPPPVSDIDLKKKEILTQTNNENNNRTFHNIRQRMIASLQEQGINTLFCAFGFCKWYDPEKPNDPLKAPLVLVPVKLTRLTVNGPYKIQRFEEDIIINPAFLKKLKEFGMTVNELEDLSPISDEEQEDENNALETEAGNKLNVLKKYLEHFTEKIKIQRGWEILEECYLGLFNYHKFVMYKDLEKNEKMIAENPFLKAIATGIYDPTDKAAQENPLELDHIPYENQYQVLDADSSQLEAIEEVKKGKDMVIQGPPGTGKSQTIVNIISELIANDKKILFVSEKQAALNVVKKRLEEKNLAPFCLELHSKKASKEEVYNQFEEILKISEVNESYEEKEDGFDFKRLSELRNKLIEISGIFNKRYGNLFLNTFDVYNELIDLTDFKDLYFNYPDFLGTDKNTLSKIKALFNRFNEKNIKYFQYIRDIELFTFPGFNRRKGSAFDKLLNEAREINKELKAHLDTERKNHWLDIVKDSEEKIERNETIIEEISSTIPRDIQELPFMEIQKEIFSESECEEIEEYNRALADIKEDYLKLQTQMTELIQTTNSDPEEFTESWQEIDEICHYLSDYKIEIFNLNLKKLKHLWETKYKSFFGRLMGGYSKNRQILLQNVQDYNEEDKTFDCYQIINKAREMKKHFDYAGYFSTENINNIVQEIRKCMDSFVKNRSVITEKKERINSFLQEKGLPVVIDDGIVSDKQHDTLKEWFDALNSIKHRLLILIDEVKGYYQGTFIKDLVRLNTEKIDEIVDRLCFIQKHRTEIERMKDNYIELNHFKLGDFINQAVEKAINPKLYYLTFKKGLMERYEEHISAQNPAIYKFNSEKDYELIKNEFRKLDKEQLQNNVIRIAKKMIDSKPDYVFQKPCKADLALLSREIAKKKWRMPVRKLFSLISEVTQILKPCMLMSPLSVSHFLDTSKISFDLVIFDEASQVLPEDSIGSIMRSGQVVVVGDNKQLPPTDFFKNAENIDNQINWDEGDTDTNLESILDEVATIGVDKRPLLWHYRSRNEDLIDFSNNHFYDGELVTFPSNHFQNEDFGVFFEYVKDGVYDRGKTRKNLKEADRIAKIIFNYAKEHPEKSLGVVTFNEAQRDAIIDILENMRKKDSSFEDFFNEDREEAFFVKNLESVQGDERDVIMFSIGYARDKEGKFFQNFGPLNKSGGERRLNVAVTRAREKNLVVSSIRYSDISPNMENGVKYLREYLMYAENASNWRKTKGNILDENSIFEKALLRRLEDNGYRVNSKVGNSKYKVDLAIVDNDNPGTYILGLLCDVHDSDTSKTIRDNERTREDVLQKLGWTTMRVWSIEWYKNPDRVFKKILDKIECIKKEKKTKNNHNVPQKSISSDISLPHDDHEFFLKRERETTNYPDFPKYELFTAEDFEQLIEKEEADITVQAISDKILEKEAPVAFNQFFKRLSAMYDYLKVNQSINPEIFDDFTTKKDNLSRAEIIKIVETIGNGYELVDDFLIKRDQKIVPRRREDYNNTEIENVYSKEREAFILSIIDQAAFLTPDDLISEIARHLGFSRTGERISAVLSEDINRLITAGRISTSDGKLTVRQNFD